MGSEMCIRDSPTTLCLWVFFSTSLQEHTDTRVGNCVFKRPSGGGTLVNDNNNVPLHSHIKSLYPLHFQIKSLYICIRSASRLKLQESTKSHHALRFSHFSHNTLFVGLLFYIPARAHRHKGRKLRFQEAQRRRHTEAEEVVVPRPFTY